MNISPQTNVSSPVSTEQKTIFSENAAATRSSSKDLASASYTSPSVKVTLSATENSVAASNAQIPSLYSKPSIAENNQTRLRTDELSDANSAGVSNADEEADSVNTSRGDTVEEREARDSDSDRAQRGNSSSEEERGLTEGEQKIVEELKARDQEVRAHEQAHKSVGGQYTGAMSFQYQSGPDGKRYAVGGEVSIYISEVPDNPQATITKMQTVKAAASAPAEPSPQDRAVAAEASRIIAQAQSEIAQEKREELEQAKTEAKEKVKDSAEDSADIKREGEESVVPGVESFQEIASLDPVDESEIRQAYSIRA